MKKNHMKTYAHKKCCARSTYTSYLLFSPEKLQHRIEMYKMGFFLIRFQIEMNDMEMLK